MKIDQFKETVLSQEELLYCWAVGVEESKLNGNLQIVFYFIDTHNCPYIHYQLCDEKNLNTLKYGRLFVSNLGFNMLNTSLADLARTYFNKNYEDRRVKLAEGRVYKGRIVRREMKGDAFKDSKKHVYFDVDQINNSRFLNQEVLMQQFQSRYKAQGWDFTKIKKIEDEGEESRDWEEMIKNGILRNPFELKCKELKEIYQNTRLK